MVPPRNLLNRTIWEIPRDYKQARDDADGMTAPYGLLVAWLVSAFISMHAVGFVAHHGNMSPLWPAAYAVSLVVPIWSPSATVGVALLLALQVAGWGLIARDADRVAEVAEARARVIVASLVAVNYLVWVLCWVVTDAATPSGNTVLFAGTASVALIAVAVSARQVTRRRAPPADKDE